MGNQGILVSIASDGDRDTRTDAAALIHARHRRSKTARGRLQVRCVSCSGSGGGRGALQQLVRSPLVPAIKLPHPAKTPQPPPQTHTPSTPPLNQPTNQGANHAPAAITPGGYAKRGGRPITWIGGGGQDPRLLATMGVPKLRELFHAVFGTCTASNNAAWLVRGRRGRGGWGRCRRRRVAEAGWPPAQVSRCLLRLAAQPPTHQAPKPLPPPTTPPTTLPS